MKKHQPKLICRNHPDQSAHRRCFLCKIPICPQCQHKAHHHIFCSAHCIATYRKDQKPVELSQRLEELDTSLNEDIREYGEVVVESIRKDFERLENELDQALTTLATMVEGSAVAAAKDLQTSKANLSSQIEKLDRKTETQYQSLEDHGKDLHKLILTTRSSIHGLQEYLEKITSQEKERRAVGETTQNEKFGRLQKDLAQKSIELEDQIKGRADAIVSTLQTRIQDAQTTQILAAEKQKESLSKLLQDSFTSQEGFVKQVVEEHIETFHTKLQKLFDQQMQVLQKNEADLKDLEEKSLPSMFQNLETRQGAHAASIETQISIQTRELKEDLEKKMSEAFSDFSKKVDQQISSRLQGVIDDIATLTIAQVGNWNQVITAAGKGAKEASEILRDELRQKLSVEVKSLAKEQATTMGFVIGDVHRALLTKIRKPISPWVKGFAFGTLGVLASLSILTPFLLVKQQQSQNVLASKKLVGELTEGLKTWLEERLATIGVSMKKDLLSSPTPMIPTLTRGNMGRKEIAFTFDAGSNAKVASEILDLLKEQNIQSTMFLTGQFVESNAEIVKRIASAGHEVGNHLMKHDHLIDPKSMRTALTRQELMVQLHQVEKRYEAVTGRSMSKLWRAPYGEINQEIIDWASSMGYTHVGWTRSGKLSLDTLDWVADPKSSLYRTPDEIMNRILAFEKADHNGLNGGIVLMHLGSERPTNEMPHRKLSQLFDQLFKKGYKGVTVSEVLRSDLAKR